MRIGIGIGIVFFIFSNDSKPWFRMYIQKSFSVCTMPSFFICQNFEPNRPHQLTSQTLNAIIKTMKEIISSSTECMSTTSEKLKKAKSCCSNKEIRISRSVWISTLLHHNFPKFLTLKSGLKMRNHGD